MFDMALITGIIIMIGVVCLVVVIAILLFRRRAASGGAGNRIVPPPVDPGPGQPEQARDVNADRTAAKQAKKDAGA
jgi:hypothetical protein